MTSPVDRTEPGEPPWQTIPELLDDSCARYADCIICALWLARLYGA